MAHEEFCRMCVTGLVIQLSCRCIRIYCCAVNACYYDSQNILKYGKADRLWHIYWAVTYRVCARVIQRKTIMVAVQQVVEPKADWIEESKRDPVTPLKRDFAHNTFQAPQLGSSSRGLCTNHAAACWVQLSNSRLVAADVSNLHIFSMMCMKF